LNCYIKLESPESSGMSGLVSAFIGGKSHFSLQTFCRWVHS